MNIRQVVVPMGRPFCSSLCQNHVDDMHKNFTWFLLIFTRKGGILTPKREKGGVEYAYNRSNHVFCTGSPVLQRLCTESQKLRTQTGIVHAFCDRQILKSDDNAGSNRSYRTSAGFFISTFLTRISDKFHYLTLFVLFYMKLCTKIHSQI